MNLDISKCGKVSVNKIDMHYQKDTFSVLVLLYYYCCMNVKCICFIQKYKYIDLLKDSITKMRCISLHMFFIQIY